MGDDLLAAVATGVLHVCAVAVIVAPFLWLAARISHKPALAPDAGRLLASAALIYLVSIVVLHLPRVGFFAGLIWNWQNKILLFGLLCALVSVWPRVRTAVGFNRPTPYWWFPVAAITLGAFGLHLLVGPVAVVPVTTETFLFQAIVPGLDEELLFRGVLFGLLMLAVSAARDTWSPQTVLVVAATSLLFGIAHGVSVDHAFTVVVEPGAIFFTGVTGAILGWVRVHTASIWPAILLHNGINLALVASVAALQ
ncbi:CPBP family intramembrane glutamic endopeptidase [Hoyosella subflava]|uniref:CAAX amino terminal protease family n=1 Tax=Hoyosella subflava (strain DSM 45089 / JCM 17490 / NBRC 109087 / DQS3-9A1) TaxID=443218 RepID=F6EIC1_HOYSD|nr:CPBP family intramembrane glutamic endopeptidase [Hoyosella subflava]AEF41228.1 CAAX amino terminal protease family [Hoyosella subflava DQS3-9A1]